MDIKEIVKAFISNNEGGHEVLSVVIITCNRQDEIVKAMDSCLAHTCRRIEFIIVDNNSSDNTESVIQQYKEINSSIELKYIKLDANTGVSYARNIGYSASSGEIVFFIDDDAEVVSDCNSLDLVHDYMMQNDDVYACTGESRDPRYNGSMTFVKNRKDAMNDLYRVRSYVGFNHFIKKGFSSNEYIYPNNLFYGSEELYVGLSVLKYGGCIRYYSNHIVQHNPSVNTRINPREGKMNGHINTYVIKSYFNPGIFKIISYLLFVCRIIRFTKGNISEIKKCISEKNKRYDSKYRNPFSMRMCVKAIREYGVKYIL
ncbi:MAG: glycosyltransferase family A protein [Oscillospiraceae bacterium]